MSFPLTALSNAKKPQPPSSDASFTCTSNPIMSGDCVCPRLLIELLPSAPRLSSTSMVLSGHLPVSFVGRWIHKNVVKHAVGGWGRLRVVAHVDDRGEEDPLPVLPWEFQLAVCRVTGGVVSCSRRGARLGKG